MEENIVINEYQETKNPEPSEKRICKINLNIFMPILGIIISVLIIVTGVCSISGVFCEYGSLSPVIENYIPNPTPYKLNTSHQQYGGDAYTGIQNAAADASNNAAAVAYYSNITAKNSPNIVTNTAVTVMALSEISNCIGICLIAFGAFGVCYFGNKIPNNKVNNT